MRAITLAIVLFSSPLAFAGGEMTCEQLADATAKADCKKKAAAECTMTGYWPKRRCESAIAEGMDACKTPAFTEACEAAEKLYWDVCNKPDADFNKPEEVTAFLERQKRIAGARKTWGEFMSRYEKCLSPGSTCQASAAHRASCEAAEGKYTEALRGQIGFVIGPVLQGRRKVIEDLVKKGDYSAAHGLAANQLAALKSYETMVPDHPGLKGEIAKLEKDVKLYEAKVKEAMAKVRCPAEVAPNPSLRATLRPILAKYLQDASADLDEKIVAFRMNGKPILKTVPASKTTYEDAPVTACVRQSEKGKPDQCRVFRATLRRQKVGKGSFGDWAYHSIGGGELMLCENLGAD